MQTFNRFHVPSLRLHTLNLEQIINQSKDLALKTSAMINILTEVVKYFKEKLVCLDRF